MRARQGPFRQPRGAERAAVADAVPQNAPGKRQLVAVLPDDPRHLTVVTRFLAVDTEEGHYPIIRLPKYPMCIRIDVERLAAHEASERDHERLREIDGQTRGGG